MSSDQVPRERTIGKADQVRQDIARSRFRLGPIRLIPVLRITDAGYDTNVFGAFEDEAQFDDWSANISGGAELIVPLGSKIFLRGSALPQYSWYNKLERRRTYGGTYRAYFLAFFNRMSLDVGGYYARGYEPLNTDLQARLLRDVRDGSAYFEIELARTVSLFARAEAQEVRYNASDLQLTDPLDVRQFNRDDSLAQAGFSFRVSPSVSLSASVEATLALFETSAEERDNETFSYLGGIQWSRPKFFLSLSGAYKEGRPFGGSESPPYETTTGSYFFTYQLTSKLGAELNGSRRVEYGEFEGLTYYLFMGNGGRLNFEIRPQVVLSGIFEYGTNDYEFGEPIPDPGRERRDTLTTYGGGLSVVLSRRLSLHLIASQTDIRSTVDRFNRSIFRLSTGLNFEGELAR